MTEIKARPTMYKGIQMRSRLEADYAAALDAKGAAWEYEPTCFASDSGQWLPDFRIDEPGGVTYVELKPAYLLDRQDNEDMRMNVDRIDTFLQRMEIAWHSEPDAWLELIFWVYDGPGAALSILGHRTRAWAAFGANLPRFPLVWPGRGQLDWLMGAKQLSAEGVRSELIGAGWTPPEIVP
jgi:hypothetical protein